MNIGRLVFLLLTLGIAVYVFDKINGHVIGAVKGKLP